MNGQHTTDKTENKKKPAKQPNDESDTDPNIIVNSVVHFRRLDSIDDISQIYQNQNLVTETIS